MNMLCSCSLLGVIKHMHLRPQSSKTIKATKHALKQQKDSSNTATGTATVLG
jgi:hypothetical protein